MSAKAIYESKAKELLSKHLAGCQQIISRSPSAVFSSNTSWDDLVGQHEWLSSDEKLIVAKPDQLIKRRGKLGLVKIDTLSAIKEWISEKMEKPFQLPASQTQGMLRRFILEPFIPHDTEADECYVSIYSSHDVDVILFHHVGGVDIGDVDAKANRLNISIDKGSVSEDEIVCNLLGNVSCSEKQKLIAKFIASLYDVFTRLHFTYIELNPLLLLSCGSIVIVDVAAKLDQCAEFICKSLWGEDIEFPPPFGREALPEEAFICDLDSKSGASLKLTILNPNGRIWTMVAGGGASVIYADTICELGGANELANYGEYSGAPSEQQTYHYAATILRLMTHSAPHENGKVLIIGGGIANFTNVAATFNGIVSALREFQLALQQHHVKIFVRRGGPNYQQGLRVMRQLGETLGVEINVFGPETHMTAIVGMALGHTDVTEPIATPNAMTTATFQLSTLDNVKRVVTKPEHPSSSDVVGIVTKNRSTLFHVGSKAIVWGLQTRAVQSMLDFDYVCSREEPSVVAMVYPMVSDHKQKFYWGHKQIMIPVYKDLDDCLRRHAEADVLINFASLRSAYESSCDVINKWAHQIHCIAIIAEGIPENFTRRLNLLAKQHGVIIIGPATVGAIKPGCFKIGNTGGMMDNIIQSKLYSPGSVAYVSRSGGMSNELNNIISLNADSVYEGVAIGGDRYPGSTFLDHVLRYEADENVKMIVLLGEVGGTEEYRIVEAIANGKITKPMIAWCIGTCATRFTSEVQFGHAGSSAQAQQETAIAKNDALRSVGVRVPFSFDQLGDFIKQLYNELIDKEIIIPKQIPPPPTVPMDYDWAQELGLIRKPASFMTSICDERGNELLYAGVPISRVIQQDFGIGGVLSLLWFRKQIPAYAAKFIELCLVVTADHGPAVSGAHNTIVCARAGKDLVSSLTSGLLTIGDRFGGAIDAAAKTFSNAHDNGQTPNDFVSSMRRQGKLIMGIGHRVKSINNPDQRVQILKDYVQKHFVEWPILNYALEVEKITTSKKPNLILNVDGFIGVSMVDLFRSCGAFTLEEANDNVNNGCLNALFVLGRSIGFIGHFLDQRRLKQGLYRHPWDDISYILPEQS